MHALLSLSSERKKKSLDLSSSGLFFAGDKPIFPAGAIPLEVLKHPFRSLFPNRLCQQLP